MAHPRNKQPAPCFSSTSASRCKLCLVQPQPGLQAQPLQKRSVCLALAPLPQSPSSPARKHNPLLTACLLRHAIKHPSTGVAAHLAQHQVALDVIFLPGKVQRPAQFPAPSPALATHGLQLLSRHMYTAGHSPQHSCPGLVLPAWQQRVLSMRGVGVVLFDDFCSSVAGVGGLVNLPPHMIGHFRHESPGCLCIKPARQCLGTVGF